MSPSPEAVLFVAGAMSAGYAVAALFFLRFWWGSRDHLFAAFAVAFLLMAVNQGVVGFSRHDHAENSAGFLLRLAAFALIIIAVLSKNGGRGSAR